MFVQRRRDGQLFVDRNTKETDSFGMKETIPTGHLAAPETPNKVGALIENLNERILTLFRDKQIKRGDAETIRDVLQRHVLRDMLLDNPEGVSALEAAQTGGHDAIEKLRLLCQGVWLESTNTFAIDEQGDLAIDVVGGELKLAPEIEANERKALYRQAILRQIERNEVFKANGLLGQKSEEEKHILDVGSGTLIGSAMMRREFPNAKITAVEPGLISSKTKSIAESKQIDLIHGELGQVNEAEKYDTIILHFILEHSVDQARDLLKQAVRHLAPGGRISIAVPNFDAFHRELETALGMNKRDSDTRLSSHDNLSGHQIIFSREKLTGLISEVLSEERTSLPVEARTILPRPFAFNTLAAQKQQRLLLDLDQGGNIPGMEEKGSVLCITIGSQEGKPEQIQGGEETAALFKEILSAYTAEHPEEEPTIASFLKDKYPELA